MQINKIKLALGLVAGLSVAMPMVASAAADQEKAMKDANNWAAPRGQYDNSGYSALAQVNKGNVKGLKAAWTFATGVNRGHEGSPVVVGNMMFVHTAFPNNVYALDLNDNQKIVWSYFPKQLVLMDLVLGSKTKRFFDCRLSQERKRCLGTLCERTSCYQQLLVNLRGHGLHR